MIIYLYLRLSYSDVTQRGGSGHGDTPPGLNEPFGGGATYLPW
jgi:hypothetical protein